MAFVRWPIGEWGDVVAAKRGTPECAREMLLHEPCEEVEGVVQLGWVPGNFFHPGPILGPRKLLPDEGQGVLHVPQPRVMLLLRQCFTYSSVCLSAL